ncbi:hypothetical protein NQ318_013637 [Aromia moschata]|uniref:DDE Tnp4 domain-containing protein n=1 Tax=Aromia moschata TaxID=1265417 RepID=A0AAV8XIZ8_9CUCU|nr:hypothetical protein NQ318_013637 [Aromia moschata]
MADPFVLDLFLDNESVSTVSRIVTDVVITLKGDTEFYSQYASTAKSISDVTNAKNNSVLSDVDFFEDTVQKFTERQYRDTFKMSRETMKKLIDYLKEKCTADLGRMIISFEKKVHLLLYILGSTESFSNIGKVVNMHKSSLCILLREMCSLVTECRFDWIKWPSLDEQNTITKRIKTFPNCVGFIDTCQFTMKTPGRNPVNAHLSSKPEYTIILQAVCDDTLKFTDIYVEDKIKHPDSVAFEGSPLCDELENIISCENHILGGANYPLKVNLMTPFNRTSSVSKRMYNKAHAASRMYIRRAFGRLKAKFRRLKYLDVKKGRDGRIHHICGLRPAQFYYRPRAKRGGRSRQ